jgi:hypothetical protein
MTTTLDSALWALGSGRWTLDYGLWALDSGNSGLWTLDYGLWTLDSGLWTLWTLDSGLSREALDYELWTTLYCNNGCVLLYQPCHIVVSMQHVCTLSSEVEAGSMHACTNEEVRRQCLGFGFGFVTEQIHGTVL